jgi:putative endonuclease
MREEAGGWAYLLSSAHMGTLYVGSTRDIVRRVHEHREGSLPGFTRKYGVTRLVWFEAFGSVAEAHARESEIKKWRRDWKIALIEENNPRWEDLYPTLACFGPLPKF